MPEESSECPELGTTGKQDIQELQVERLARLGTLIGTAQNASAKQDGFVTQAVLSHTMPRQGTGEHIC